DLPALKYAVMLNGVTELVMTKADVLSGFDSINVCTHYLQDGEKIDYMPYDIISVPVEPVYETLPGWGEDITGIEEPQQIPQTLRNYIGYLEKQLGVPIRYLSVGPDRRQTLILD